MRPSCRFNPSCAHVLKKIVERTKWGESILEHEIKRVKYQADVTTGRTVSAAAGAAAAAVSPASSGSSILGKSGMSSSLMDSMTSRERGAESPSTELRVDGVSVSAMLSCGVDSSSAPAFDGVSALVICSASVEGHNNYIYAEMDILSFVRGDLIFSYKKSWWLYFHSPGIRMILFPFARDSFSRFYYLFSRSQDDFILILPGVKMIIFSFTRCQDDFIFNYQGSL